MIGEGGMRTLLTCAGKLLALPARSQAQSGTTRAGRPITTRAGRPRSQVGSLRSQHHAGETPALPGPRSQALPGRAPNSEHVSDAYRLALVWYTKS